MQSVSEMRFLTINMQRIIKLMYGRNLSFKTQDVFEDQQSFRNCMNALISNRIAKIDKIITKDGIETQYKLTLNGVVLWENVLRGFK